MLRHQRQVPQLRAQTVSLAESMKMLDRQKKQAVHRFLQTLITLLGVLL